ncbi:MAG: hypothetical protein J7L55_03140 [Desulfurococcales archaeon]|nr:hypothetical protein [Desulfurococcales archaeon]
MLEVREDLSLEEGLKVLEELLRCSVWLEERTADLYDSISSRMRVDEAASIMKVIAAQSRAHAETMRALMKLLKVDDGALNEEVCLKLTKPVGPVTKKLLEDVDVLRAVGSKEFGEVLEDLRFLESGIGEETYMRVLQPLLKSVLIELKKDVLSRCAAWDVKELIVNELIKDVVRQEALHELLVRKASKVIEVEERRKDCEEALKK